MEQILAKKKTSSSSYTRWIKDRSFEVGISYGSEGIIIMYYNSKRSYFQFVLEGKQHRFWVTPPITKRGLTRLARRQLRTIETNC